MSQDKSNLQVVEQFSFIYTLTHSRERKTEQIDRKLAVDIHESTKTNEREACTKLIPASMESDSVTLSSVLGFSDFINNNESALCLFNESISDRSFAFSQQAQLPGQQKQNNSFITKHLGKVFLLLSSSYFIFMACWLAGHDYYGKIFPFSALRATLDLPESQVSTSDLQFIDYLQRSLNNLELKQSSQVSDSIERAENSEVVYVPVYNLNKDRSSSRHSLDSPGNYSSLPVPIIPPPPPRKIESTNYNTSLPKNNRNQDGDLPLTSISQSSANNNKEVNSTSTAQSSVKNYTLIGIFELGKRSAALFKVDGMTKRIWVGDRLDSRGWILDSVADRKAKISRQGETRFLSVGDKF